MKKNKVINIGGVNGLGESLVNTNSQSFKALKDAIVSHSSSQSESDVVRNKIISLIFQMESYLSDSETRDIIPAGSFIEKLLKATGISKKKFSEYIDYDYSNLIATLKGRRKINPDLAIKTGKIFSISPAIWLHIESKNELSAYLKNSSSYDDYNLLELIK
jgi:plasmid maintenance system antidote protein VapI